MARVVGGAAPWVMSLPSDGAFSLERCCSDCFLQQQRVELTEAIWADRAFHLEVWVRMGWSTFQAVSGASSSSCHHNCWSSPSWPHQQSSGTNTKVLAFSSGQKSVFNSQCWRLNTNYVIFNQSLNQHLLSTYCILGPEMDTVLGIKSAKVKDKFKEHWAQ